jgi:hypothetical protein
MNLEEKVKKAVDGEIESLIVLAELKQEKKVIDAYIKEIEEIALDEAEMYEKTFELKGWKFERRSGGASYDFSNIPDWNDKKQELKSLEAKAKAAYSSYKQGLLTATNDGEEVMLPIVKNRKDSLVIKKID